MKQDLQEGDLDLYGEEDRHQMDTLKWPQCLCINIQYKSLEDTEEITKGAVVPC